jgi:hypothetical protein
MKVSAGFRLYCRHRDDEYTPGFLVFEYQTIFCRTCRKELGRPCEAEEGMVFSLEYPYFTNGTATLPHIQTSD